MACVEPDGSLSELAKKVLAAVAAGADAATLAKQVGVPLFRVRASLRELKEAGLIEGSDERLALTERGEQALEA